MGVISKHTLMLLLQIYFYKYESAAERQLKRF